MLVNRNELISYSLDENYYFARRTGAGDPISRDQYFIDHADQLVEGIYCAIGSDELGWELEQYNGVNWAIVQPDPSYLLTVTSDGLKALTNTIQGGLRLYFSGVKIVNAIVKNPVTPLVNWTDTDLLQLGEVVFSCGTNGAAHTGLDDLSEIFRWRYNSASGGMQYILTLPTEGLGSTSDNAEDDWDIGTIGLYVKDPSNNTTDVLFGVATLPDLIHKHATTLERIGNTIRLNFNTVLTNLGYVANVEMVDEGEQNIPEVPNESLLLYPTDTYKRGYNCYLVDSLFGTNTPALAVRKMTGVAAQYQSDWQYFLPAGRTLTVDPSQFAENVKNYQFVYWNHLTLQYELAEGMDQLNPNEPDATVTTQYNTKMPMGIRIGNSIIFSGEVTNNVCNYEYSLYIANPGSNYKVGDKLLIPADDENSTLIFDIYVTEVDQYGGITSGGFVFVGPKSANVNLFSASTTTAQEYSTILPAIYNPNSELPHFGDSARFKIVQTETPGYAWNFDGDWLNKPVYCDNSKGEFGAGNPTLLKTDSFLGWVTGNNSIKLALDLRNEASTENYGTTRYATNAEVKDSYIYTAASQQTAVTPKILKANYLQTTLSADAGVRAVDQPGDRLGNPINVETYVRFDKVVLGKGTSSPYDDTAINPNVTDESISFYGLSYRSWYKDLAEFYESDEYYEPGTLITFGKGLKEITKAIDECDGVISSNPGYQLGEKRSKYDLPVALVGRVPVLLDGSCLAKFGDKIYLSKIKKGCASTVPNGKCLGKIIAKDFGTANLVECVVRIDF